MFLHTLMFFIGLTIVSFSTIACWTLTYPVYFAIGLLGLASKAPRSQQLGSIILKKGAQFVVWMTGVGVFVGKRSQEKNKEYENKNVLYVFNHSTNLDPFIITSAVSANCRFVHKRELAMVPILGQALYCSGHVSVNRANRSKAVESLKEAEDFLTKPPHLGGSIGIAPEGTRTRDGNLITPFKKGPFHIAKNTGALLVPVVVRGGFPIFPPGSMDLKPNMVSVRILEALDPKEYGNDVDKMKDALEKVFIENVKDEAWKEGDIATEADRPISANRVFPVAVCLIVYKLSVFALGMIW